MHRTSTVATSLLVLRLWAGGQEVVRFDTVHQNVVGSFAVGYGVYEIDSGYRVFSLQKGFAEQSQDVYVTDFDMEGGLMSERTFQTPKQDFFGYSSAMAPATEGHFGGMARFGPPDYLDSLFVYRFGNDGDTLWTRFVAVDTAWAYRNMSRTTTGDLLLTGTHYPPREAYVFRLDSLGLIKSYHGYAGFDGEDVVEGRDGSWYLGGRGVAPDILNKAVLVRSDTLGNVLWQEVLPLYGQYRSLISLRDFGIVGLGSTGDGAQGGYSLAIKYDTSGAEIWRRDLLQSDDADRASRFHGGFENEDSSLTVCGWLSRADTFTKGTVVRLNKHGDVLWSRLYSHFAVGGVLPWQMFWDVKPTSDGGMVLTGEANSEDYPYAQLWLLKLDSMGCLVPGCGNVGVQEYTDLFNGKLVVSPNPARDQVSVALDLGEGIDVSGQVRAIVLDATGRTVLEQSVQQDLNLLRTSLEVSALPEGTYYLHLRDAKRWLAGSKVVVE